MHKNNFNFTLNPLDTCHLFALYKFINSDTTPHGNQTGSELNLLTVSEAVSMIAAALPVGYGYTYLIKHAVCKVHQFSTSIHPSMKREVEPHQQIKCAGYHTTKHTHHYHFMEWLIMVIWKPKVTIHWYQKVFQNKRLIKNTTNHFHEVPDHKIPTNFFCPERKIVLYLQ